MCCSVVPVVFQFFSDRSLEGAVDKWGWLLYPQREEEKGKGMRISTKGRYAVRAMLDLALHGQEGPVRRVDIADRQHISANYIAQLFLDLQEAGLVVSVKGPGGGYVLAKSPADIRVGDIIRAVEGPIALVECVAPSEEPCPLASDCVTRKIWKEASEAISEVLNGITLDDLRLQACQLAPHRSELCQEICQ